jgi:SagB-type dehydrogenase family enzyme
MAVAGQLPYDALYSALTPPSPFNLDTIGEFLRCSMGDSRWALRVNPSSGNLHPTEAYVVLDGAVCHYAPREHALEERCAIETAWADFCPRAGAGFLVGLSSIHWREAWKYGERAFRYCQHDLGHAIGALRLAASLLGWRLAVMERWSDAQAAALFGLDRDDDYQEAEREYPECVAVVTSAGVAAWLERDPGLLTPSARNAAWHGKANRLSVRHVVDWPLIDEVADSTRYPGRDPAGRRVEAVPPSPDAARPAPSDGSSVAARSVILARRSALAFDAESGLSRSAFFAMLRRLKPPAAPWDAIDWPPQVHLALFVHRVEGLSPGIYAFLRDAQAVELWKSAMREEFLWERVRDPDDPAIPGDLYLLAPLDVRRLANRLSCNQDIAEDGFFSLGMIARLEAALAEYGEWFYRRLFWECGMIGQVLYLEAEPIGTRSTGIGCFYDDPVHEVLGLRGHAWQSLYHFSMGVPVEDERLTTDPGYPWERDRA